MSVRLICLMSMSVIRIKLIVFLIYPPGNSNWYKLTLVPIKDSDQTMQVISLNRSLQ